MNERKRNALYYKNNSFYVGDNLARKIAEPEIPENYRRAQREKKRRLEARKAAKRKAKLFKAGFITVTSVVVISFCVALLAAISKNNELTSQISSMESQIEELAVLNDSREYAIDSSVDLDYVVQVAINELGMVRSSAGQIKTYDTKETEYVQQVAGIPTE